MESRDEDLWSGFSWAEELEITGLRSQVVQVGGPEAKPQPPIAIQVAGSKVKLVVSGSRNDQ